MYARHLVPPRSAFFLFGPRGTGKSTWLRTCLPGARTWNLLRADLMLRYEREPEQFRAEVEAQPRDAWVVVDEIQRAPRLLDEVHFLMEERGYRRFALTGSSARKLRRGAANLLAGRAVVKHLFPLTGAETGFSIPIAQRLRFGTLPIGVNAPDDEAREEFLRAYVTTYLAEEIKAEALVRNLGSFGRFLRVAACAAGQTTNVTGLARESGVSRETARGYFEVLVDTLIGDWLPAYRPRAKVKEVALPKFYWFDSGALNAAAGAFDQPMPSDWDGVLLEHLVWHELRAHLHYSGTKGSLGYWGTPSGSEVDFLFWRGDEMVAVEVKHGARFRAEFCKGIASLTASLPRTVRLRAFVVYRGTEELRRDGVRVLPVERFLRALHAGDVLG